MFRVETTLAAQAAISRVPGLHKRVEDALIGVLQTADAMRRLNDGHFAGISDEAMRVRVGNYLVTYTVDAGCTTATVLGIERGEQNAA